MSIAPIGKIQKLQSIQGLRGIAATLVLFFHMASFQRQMAENNSADVELLSGIWDHGWAGVDLFFVISGFIMVYVTQNSGRHFKDVGSFMFSRVTRIYPLWWVCAGIMTLYFSISYGMPAAPDRVADSREAMSYAVKSFLLIPQQAEPTLALGWTLIHEMFFYAVFAILLFVPREYLPWALALWAGLTAFAAQFILPAAFGRTFTELAASPLSLEFIAGGLVGYLVATNRFFHPQFFFILGLVLSALALIFFPIESDKNFTVLRVAVFTLPFIFLTYGWVCGELKKNWTVPRWLSHLGDWSYSLYLTHYIVLVTLRRIYPSVFPENWWVGADGIWDNILFALLSLSLSVLTAALFYNLIERPSLRFFKKRGFKNH